MVVASYLILSDFKVWIGEYILFYEKTNIP